MYYVTFCSSLVLVTQLPYYSHLLMLFHHMCWLLSCHTIYVCSCYFIICAGYLTAAPFIFAHVISSCVLVTQLPHYSCLLMLFHHMCWLLSYHTIHVCSCYFITCAGHLVASLSMPTHVVSSLVLLTQLLHYLCLLVLFHHMCWLLSCYTIYVCSCCFITCAGYLAATLFMFAHVFIFYMCWLLRNYIYASLFHVHALCSCAHISPLWGKKEEKAEDNVQLCKGIT